MTEARVLRPRQTHRLLGMGRTMFNTLVRPNVSQLPLGERGIGFDKEELDRWLEEYSRYRGQPPPHRRCRSTVPRSCHRGD